MAARTLDRYADILAAWIDWLEAQALGMRAFSRLELGRYYDQVLRGPTGRHGQLRSQTTAARHIEAIQVFWVWVDAHAEELGLVVPRPVKLELPRVPHRPTRAPTWAELDQVIAQLDGWARRVAVVLRFTGARRSEALALTWADVDLVAGEITWRGDITKGGYGGRRVPLHPALAAELAAWPKKASTVVGAPDAELLGRGHLDRSLNRAWARTGLPDRPWRGQPTHAFRKGVYTGLVRAGADPDMVRLVVGHQLDAVKRAYVDVDLLPLRAVVGLIPPIAQSAQSSHSTSGLGTDQEHE